MDKREQIIQMIKNGVSINLISKKLNVAKSTIYYHYKKIKGRKNLLVIIPQDNKIIGEFLGAFSGDGSYYFDKKVYHHNFRIHLHAKDDLRYALYLKELIEQKFNKKVLMYKRAENQMFLSFYSRKIYDLTNNFLEIQGNKTLNVSLKKPLKELSDDFLKYFTRGLFDTDGNVGDCRVRVKCISRNLIEQTSAILNKFNIVNKVCRVKDKRTNCRDCYEITVNKSQMPKFLRIIGLSNPRKLAKLKEVCDGRGSNFRTISRN